MPLLKLPVLVSKGIVRGRRATDLEIMDLPMTALKSIPLRPHLEGGYPPIAAMRAKEGKSKRIGQIAQRKRMATIVPLESAGTAVAAK